jgi:protein phosphatase
MLPPPDAGSDELDDDVTLPLPPSEVDPVDTTPLETEDLSAIQTGKKSPPPGNPETVLKVASRCHVGAIRERNEDSCLVLASEAGGHFPLLPFGLYIVADGMGGHKNGHTASKAASRVSALHIVRNIYMPLLQDEGMPQTPVQEVLEDAALAAHTAIYDPDPDKDSGTTLSIALVLGRRLYVAHVGDSRVYLLTDGKLEAVTKDHSLVQRLQDVGQLTAEDASMYQYRHILLRALGQEEEVEIDTYMRLLPKSGSLLLCSDGLSGMVTDEQIQTVLSSEQSAEQKANELFELAMAAGGYDNITAIVVDFDF